MFFFLVKLRYTHTHTHPQICSIFCESKDTCITGMWQISATIRTEKVFLFRKKKRLLQVVVKDFVSRAVVSQFRAHTSPISALCFDPSGTLLVTASIHGNNINIFRIMPSSSRNGSLTQPYDWGSSYVHLYKLHRGMTSAVCSYPLCLLTLVFSMSMIVLFSLVLNAGNTRHLF